MQLIVHALLFCAPLSSFRLRFNHSVYWKPQPDKANKIGEDAYFSDPHLIVVADGVGGWIRVGIDSSKYSWALCKLMASIFKKDQGSYSKNPKQLVVEAARKNRERASATVLVGAIDSEKEALNVANVGDCGYVILRLVAGKEREYWLGHQSEPQQHSFNFPY